MSIEEAVIKRGEGKCELCAAADNLSVFEVTPADVNSDHYVLLCDTCKGQIEDTSTIDPKHWHCLNDSMWSPVAGVQALSYRQLRALNRTGETWAGAAIDMLYMEPDIQRWANIGVPEDDEEDKIVLDINGTRLQNGDNVTLTKDMVITGGNNFTAKQGTMVRNIRLSRENDYQYEGKINGFMCIMKAKNCKKQ